MITIDSSIKQGVLLEKFFEGARENKPINSRAILGDAIYECLEWNPENIREYGDIAQLLGEKEDEEPTLTPQICDIIIDHVMEHDFSSITFLREDSGYYDFVATYDLDYESIAKEYILDVLNEAYRDADITSVEELTHAIEDISKLREKSSFVDSIFENDPKAGLSLLYIQTCLDELKEEKTSFTKDAFYSLKENYLKQEIDGGDHRFNLGYEKSDGNVFPFGSQYDYEAEVHLNVTENTPLGVTFRSCFMVEDGYCEKTGVFFLSHEELKSMNADDFEKRMNEALFYAPVQKIESDDEHDEEGGMEY